MENINTYTPLFFYVNGEYQVSRLFDDGTSVAPSFFPVKEVDLKKIYGLSDKDIEGIPNYVGYTLRPENNPEKYKRKICLGDGLYNLNSYDLPMHAQGRHETIENSTNWPNILNLLLHIAPNKKPFPTSRLTYSELMLDYLAIAWKTPKKNLPILVLVSKERSTGKTTFLQLIQLMFQSNARIVTENDLASQYNRYWGTCNFILVDEAKIPKSLMSRIRSESTAKTRGINEKYQAQSTIASFSKFIMASNDIDNFAHIDIEENRYFVIEVPPFQPGTEKSEYDELMKAELPQFLDYLMNHHQIKTGNHTRMSFHYDDYKTPALDRVINGSKSSVHLKVEEALELLNDNGADSSEENIWEFSLTSFRNHLLFDKGKESEIKDTFRKLGVQSDDRKTRFTCAYSRNKTNAIRYFITVGDLKSIFDFNETTIDMDENVEIEIKS